MINCHHITYEELCHYRLQKKQGTKIMSRKMWKHKQTKYFTLTLYSDQTNKHNPILSICRKRVGLIHSQWYGDTKTPHTGRKQKTMGSAVLWLLVLSRGKAARISRALHREKIRIRSNHVDST